MPMWIASECRCNIVSQNEGGGQRPFRFFPKFIHCRKCRFPYCGNAHCTLSKKRMKIFFTAFIDWFSHMCISDVNEHICRVSEMLVTFETLAGRGVLESLQLFRICIEHQSLPLFAHLRQNTISFKSGNG